MPMPTQFFTEADINVIGGNTSGTLFTVIEVGSTAEIMIQSTERYSMNNLQFEARGYGAMYDSKNSFVKKAANSFGSGTWGEFIDRTISNAITLPYTTVTEGLFSGYTQFRASSITFTNPVTLVNNSAFRNVSSTYVTNGITIELSNATVGDYAFAGANINNISGLINVIGQYSFSDSNITSIEISDTCQLKEGCFVNCVNLTNFKSTNLITQGNLSSSATLAFRNCDSLVYLEIADDVDWDLVDGLFLRVETQLATTVKTNNSKALRYDWLTNWNRVVTFISEARDFLAVSNGTTWQVLKGYMDDDGSSIAVKNSDGEYTYVRVKPISDTTASDIIVYMNDGPHRLGY